MSTFEDQYIYGHINTNTTTTLKSSFGKLHSIVVNFYGTSETVTVYDGTSDSGTVIAIMQPNAVNCEGTYIYDVIFNTGLTIVTSGTTAPDLTVCYA